MLAQRMVVTRIDDMLELMKDYVKDIGPNSRALTIEFNPSLQQLALVFVDPDCRPTDRENLLTKFELKRNFNVGGQGIIDTPAATSSANVDSSSLTGDIE